MTSTNINYIDNYFQYPDLTKIHGEPTYEGLQQIKDQLKCNAVSVTSSSGGGAHGLLGLVLNADEYARLSRTPFEQPVFPVLTLPNPCAGPLISQLTREFSERMRVFRESIDVKKALIKQIVAAIDQKYLRTLRNDDTHSITTDIPVILTYLFNRYGKVTPDKLNDKETEVRSFVYNLQDPLVSLFDQVEDLKKLGDAAQMPYTTRQLLNFGVQLIRNTHDFLDGLKSWIEKREDEKNWTNFKLHFEDEHDKLKLIRGMTMKHAGFHQANFIASQVMEEVQSVQSNVLQLLQKQEDKENLPPPEPVESKANAATSTDPALTMQMEMLKLIKSLQHEVKELKNARPPLQPRHNDRNNPNQNSLNYRGRQWTDKYCWSHGACGHAGSDCRYKKDGHKDKATFKNKMNGSTLYCQGTNDN